MSDTHFVLGVRHFDEPHPASLQKLAHGHGQERRVDDGEIAIDRADDRHQVEHVLRSAPVYERHDEEQSGDGTHECAASVQGMAVEHGVEDGEHPPLELGTAGHGQRGERRLRGAMGRSAE